MIILPILTGQKKIVKILEPAITQCKPVEFVYLQWNVCRLFLDTFQRRLVGKTVRFRFHDFNRSAMRACVRLPFIGFDILFPPTTICYRLLRGFWHSPMTATQLFSFHFQPCSSMLFLVDPVFFSLLPSTPTLWRNVPLCLSSLYYQSSSIFDVWSNLSFCSLLCSPGFVDGRWSEATLFIGSSSCTCIGNRPASLLLFS